VAAIGIADAKWGERPMLFVVPDAAADPDDVRVAINTAYGAAIADGSISKWALPDRIDMVGEIAKTSVGKIDKKRLRAQITLEQ